MKYTPLDDLLARPRVRALRVLLRHADWVTSSDLYDACGVSDVDLERNAFAVVLSALVRSGDIQRCLVPTGRRRLSRPSSVGQYRITDNGRESLRALIESANPHPSEFCA